MYLEHCVTQKTYNTQINRSIWHLRDHTFHFSHYHSKEWERQVTNSTVATAALCWRKYWLSAEQWEYFTWPLEATKEPTIKAGSKIGILYKLLFVLVLPLGYCSCHHYRYYLYYHHRTWLERLYFSSTVISWITQIETRKPDLELSMIRFYWNASPNMFPLFPLLALVFSTKTPSQDQHARELAVEGLSLPLLGIKGIWRSYPKPRVNLWLLGLE